MKELRKKLWAKLLAAVLLFLLLTAVLTSAALTVVLAKHGAYDGGTAEGYAQGYVNDEADLVTGRILSIETTDVGIYLSDELAEEFDGQEPSNFAFVVTSATGTPIYTYGDTGSFLYEKSWSIERARYGEIWTRTGIYATQEQLEQTIAQMEAQGSNIVSYVWNETTQLATIQYQPRQIMDVIKVTGGLDASFPQRDNVFYIYRVLQFGMPLRYWLIAIAAVGALCSLLLAVFLCSGAGRRAGDDELHETFLDRMPLGCYFLLTALLGLIPRWLVRMGEHHYSCHTAVAIAALILALIVSVVLLLGLLLTLCTRLKQRGWWRNTLIYRVLRPAAKALWRGLCALWRNLPLYWKSGIVWLVLCVVEGLAFWERLPVVWLLEKLLLTPLFIACIIFLRRLQRGAESISGGDYRYQIDVSHMPQLLREHGQQLNHIGDGLQHAVEECMRSERMKAELITNVSHDIKTPLTSIINYVDLMEKEEIDNPKVQEYLEVLDRQSARLKKLIEDLMEASKASTGNIKVELEECDATVMLTQVVGEFEDRAKKNDLDIVVSSPEPPANIMADGRHLWRVIDNLMSNICKYAQPGTRVYIDLEKYNGMVIMTFRNTSRYQLNISSEELMERFVRGDSSRNTEGSGLGLSIAQSLTALMGGNFAIQIDGDLFKAILSFDECE